MTVKKFSDTPNFGQRLEDGRYLGTWYYCDCYVCGTTLLVRHGDEPGDYASCSKLGYNEFDPTLKIGGLGENRPWCEVKVEGIPGYENNTDRAGLCACAYLGREVIDAKQAQRPGT